MFARFAGRVFREQRVHAKETPKRRSRATIANIQRDLDVLSRRRDLFQRH